MLRVAIVETEEIAKDIMFELASLLENQEWSFQYFTKISQLANAENKKEFQIIIFHEKFEIPRVNQSFILNKPQRIVIYTKTKITKAEKEILPFSRIFYIDRVSIKHEVKRISKYIELLLKNQEEYLFSYNNVEVPLKIKDIYYIEKEDKYLIYHTKRGEFRERKNMKDANEYFKSYHFLWIHASYLVNMQYITQIHSDIVYLSKEQLPISRAKKAEVSKTIRQFMKLKIEE
ncbi:LytR/AlgR family response regulator transcription factor [Amedibacillus sp. YH-ame10]